VPADLTSERDRMVDSQIAGRGIADRHVLDAMRHVRRERFVTPGFEEFAYEDTPLPIDEGQTISQPYIVALMIEAAAVRPGDKVLDVGTGSGYAAAVVSLIADHVYTIERHEALAQTTRSTSTPSAWSASIRSLAPISRATSTTETRSRTSWPAHPISRATLSCISDFAAQWIRLVVSAGARLPIG
jgi:Protein-L-isoaspartate(D-aspartate) O-methyltransferase (PCMT)